MKLLITSALLFLTVSNFAQAERHHGYFKAKVINSSPVYKYVMLNQPQKYCEPVVSRKSHKSGAALVGGIIGGVIGHATSDKNHKGLGAVAGAIIGSSLAHNIEKSNNGYVQQQSCVVSHAKAKKVRVIDGYKVTYRSQGTLYKTFRQSKPSKYIRIYY
jgi:uncharacterized protein YcfJ